MHLSIIIPAFNEERLIEHCLRSVSTALAAQAPRRAPAGPQKPAPGPRTIDVTVREGTSMSVSISPDGSTIATDMQGSIWTMPAAGGPMTRITDVFSDARQPRWSPDGRHYPAHP